MSGLPQEQTSPGRHGMSVSCHQRKSTFARMTSRARQSSAVRSRTNKEVESGLASPAANQSLAAILSISETIARRIEADGPADLDPQRHVAVINDEGQTRRGM